MAAINIKQRNEIEYLMRQAFSKYTGIKIDPSDDKFDSLAILYRAYDSLTNENLSKRVGISGKRIDLLTIWSYFLHTYLIGLYPIIGEVIGPNSRDKLFKDLHTGDHYINLRRLFYILTHTAMYNYNHLRISKAHIAVRDMYVDTQLSNDVNFLNLTLPVLNSLYSHTFDRINHTLLHLHILSRYMPMIGKCRFILRKIKDDNFKDEINTASYKGELRRLLYTRLNENIQIIINFIERDYNIKVNDKFCTSLKNFITNDELDHLLGDNILCYYETDFKGVPYGHTPYDTSRFEVDYIRISNMDNRKYGE